MAMKALTMLVALFATVQASQVEVSMDGSVVMPTDNAGAVAAARALGYAALHGFGVDADDVADCEGTAGIDAGAAAGRLNYTAGDGASCFQICSSCDTCTKFVDNYADAEQPHCRLKGGTGESYSARTGFKNVYVKMDMSLQSVHPAGAFARGGEYERLPGRKIAPGGGLLATTCSSTPPRSTAAATDAGACADACSACAPCVAFSLAADGGAPKCELHAIVARTEEEEGASAAAEGGLFLRRTAVYWDERLQPDPDHDGEGARKPSSLLREAAGVAFGLGSGKTLVATCTDAERHAVSFPKATDPDPELASSAGAGTATFAALPLGHGSAAKPMPQFSLRSSGGTSGYGQKITERFFDDGGGRAIDQGAPITKSVMDSVREKKERMLAKGKPSGIEAWSARGASHTAKAGPDGTQLPRDQYWVTATLPRGGGGDAAAAAEWAATEPVGDWLALLGFDTVDLLLVTGRAADPPAPPELKEVEGADGGKKGRKGRRRPGRGGEEEEISEAEKIPRAEAEAYFDAVAAAEELDAAAAEAQWRVAIAARAAGKVGAIGVTGFETRAAIEALTAATGVEPAVVQLEVHPWVDQERRELVAWCQARGIVVSALNALGRVGDGDDDMQGWVARLHGMRSRHLALREALALGLQVASEIDDVHREYVRYGLTHPLELSPAERAAIASSPMPKRYVPKSVLDKAKSELEKKIRMDDLEGSPN